MLQGVHIGNYCLQNKISEGSYGQIYIVEDSISKAHYVAKICTEANEIFSIINEAQILNSIQNSLYFPKFIDSGKNSFFSYLIIENIGPSLHSIKSLCNLQKFSESTSLRVGFHTLCALNYLHFYNILHLDLKPSNILVNINMKPSDPPIKLIDFGLSEHFKFESNQNSKEQSLFHGSYLYSSPNAHLCKPLSFSDDLFNWFFVLLELLQGKLSWDEYDEKDILIYQSKCNFNPDLSLSRYPELSTIYNHIKSLSYGEYPDYIFLFTIYQKLMNRLLISFDNGIPYDWTEFFNQQKDNSNQSLCNVI